ncbi:VWA domain-containing protein [Frankia sp. CNm7]|uniref:VWA domain-containing protein n=1 Tax=Frankia nepalensis TaxID=1836974 RepID=A0A937RHW4_9ACTN|nr:VWA domain-containing protein [Frankia nepalensis]MBL7497225.1 VWA domain-containing protein [Frankia nepalensis]MBL7510340.1 VWA domain-containing protein [Frankia nepalensis]MBL7519226.1 VWA domain-containing protein [Frankia nepalensis]MBL7626678.1 VWA domain-containing protein [Frankia nepalensis]
MELTKGANAALDAGDVEITVSWRATAGSADLGPSLDVCALRLGADGKVREDADLVFFNAPSSPDGSVRHIGRTPDGAGEVVTVDTTRQPADVASIVVTATIDVVTPHLTFGGLAVSARVADLATGAELARFTPPPLGPEKALVVVELYRRGGSWKIRAVGQGYASGLAGLATDYGVDVSADEDVSAPAAPLAPTAPAAPTAAVPAAAAASAADLPSTGDPRVDMRKRLDLRKKTVQAVLTKQGIPGRQARVALALDASGSMRALYRAGTVARVVERVAAVAATMDDDGTLEVWSYATEPVALPPLRVDFLADWIPLYVRMRKATTGQGGADATLARERAARAAGWPIPNWDAIGGQNEEPKVMALILEHYERLPSPPPTLVLVLTDGGLYRDKQIAELLRRTAKLPIFWQFVGIGRARYGILEKLDTLAGRVVDNAGFFAVDDLDAIDDETLYQRILGEFPAWLRAARAAGIPL